MSNRRSSSMESSSVSLPEKCSGLVVRDIDAPLPLLWSIVRKFEKPQAYKRFVKSAILRSGDGDIGSIREVCIVSGLPASRSIERLDVLDDRLHIISFSIIGGDHQLSNYQSTMLLQQKNNEPRKTSVMQSYKMDVPAGNTKEEMCYFINNIIRWNLESLASVSNR